MVVWKGFQKSTSQLLRDVRAFWFGSTVQHFHLGTRVIKRWEIHLYGGPNPEFNDCPTCQVSEWLSRLDQRSAFLIHDCPTATLCRTYCERQGDDRWTHYHQNFWYAAFVNDDLPALRCAMIQPTKGIKYIWRHHCDQFTHIFLRQFAQVCQFDVIEHGEKVNGNRYDFVFVNNSGVTPSPVPSDLPVLMYGPDCWNFTQRRQRMIDELRPEVFWSPWLAAWRTHYRFPDETKMVFRPIPAGTFFTRPNLNEKEVDLLCIGKTGEGIYSPRADLARQLEAIDGNYEIHIHSLSGAPRAVHDGPNDADGARYANAWSAFLGSAKYVVFAGISVPPQPVTYKHYETLGSGAIPIFPDAPELKDLGIVPWEHFIPVGAIRDDNDYIRYLLDNYHRYWSIAESAVAWYKENADHLLFDGIDDLMHTIVGGQYERRSY